MLETVQHMVLMLETVQYMYIMLVMLVAPHNDVTAG